MTHIKDCAILAQWWLLESTMANEHYPEGKRARGKADDPYCEFRSDRERRNALVSRDVRLVLCRLLTVVGTVTVVVRSAPGQDIMGVLARLLGLL